MVRVADYVADFIWRAGVRKVFLVSGGGIMHLTDGLACHKKLGYLCCHHEQAAAMAAEAYGRAAGVPGVCYLTTGPGATNAFTGIISAWQDSISMLVIAGQAKRKEAVYNSGLALRQFGTQEVNTLPMVKEFTNYSVLVNEPAKIRYHLEKALYLARTGRPGPSWVEIPLDVQGAQIDPAKLEGFVPDKTDSGEAELVRSVGHVVRLLKQARRPVIIAGNGIRCSGAIPAFLKFVRQTGIPVVTPRLGADLMETDDPLFAGRPGIKGDRSGNFAVQNSDLVLAIGSSLKVQVIGYEYPLFAREAKKVVVDIDPVEHSKPTIAIDLFIRADAGRFLKLASSAAKSAGVRCDASWPAACRNWKKKYPVILPQYAKLAKINMYHFMDRLNRRLNGAEIVISDAGSAFYVVGQAVQVKKGTRLICPGSQAMMGYSLPAGVGAASAADSGTRVVCITGDGSMQMNIQELQTVVHNRLPVKIFVLNNGGYLSIRNTQVSFFAGRFLGEGPTSGVSCPDFVKVSQAYGVKAFRVSRPKDLDDAIGRVMREKGPILCEVMCDPKQAIIPSVSSEKKPSGEMVSKPLEDMYPFLPREEFRKNMFVKPVGE
jgi:acetolactate synthase-1/2/3 large subunit